MAQIFQNFNRIHSFNSFGVTLRYFSVNPKDTCTRKIFNHFHKNGQASSLNLFPSELKRVTTKKDSQIYVAEEAAAQQIAEIISQFHTENVPFFELNPGPCILSNALIQKLNLKKFGLIEKNEEFLDIQKKFQKAHGSKVSLKSVKPIWTHYGTIANFIWEKCQGRQWHEDIAYQMFTCFQTDDVYRLVMDVIRQRRLFSNGRAEIFAIISPLEYKKLTAGPDSTYWIYTQHSCIFQILFEYELLAEVPRDSFLPWRNPKQAYGGKVEYDDDVFYLVRMVPRRNLFSLCPRDELLLLRFFVYQCFFKRKGYIIPKLEKWIPGIGVDLITAKFAQNSSPRNESNNLSSETECNWSSHLGDTFDVFTECGSLTPFQICALFRYFRQLPEYKNSCFHQQCNEFHASKMNKILDSHSPISDDEDAPTISKITADAKH